MKLLKIKIGLAQIIKTQIIILVAIVFLAFIYSGAFLYKNFYKPIVSTEEIVILRNQIALEKINTNLFDKVMENLENKKIAPDIDWATFLNPFSPYSGNISPEKTE